MTKPSELKEDEWITLVAHGGAHKSCISFHVYYGELWAFASHPDAEPDDVNCGLGITNKVDQADALYDLYKNSKHITERKGGWRMFPNPDYPISRTCEKWSETVRTGIDIPESDGVDS